MSDPHGDNPHDANQRNELIHEIMTRLNIPTSLINDTDMQGWYPFTTNEDTAELMRMIDSAAGRDVFSAVRDVVRVMDDTFGITAEERYARILAVVSSATHITNLLHGIAYDSVGDTVPQPNTATVDDITRALVHTVYTGLVAIQTLKYVDIAACLASYAEQFLIDSGIGADEQHEGEI